MKDFLIRYIDPLIPFAGAMYVYYLVYFSRPTSSEENSTEQRDEKTTNKLKWAGHLLLVASFLQFMAKLFQEN